MSNAALDRCTAALGDANVRAFLHVIGAGESGQGLTDLDYRVINGGSHFDAPPWVHPYYNIPTTRGGRAAGAFQFLGTTFARCDEALGLGGDFSPASQNVAAVYLMATRGALAAVIRGDLDTAVHKLKDEWISLPNLTAHRITQVFTDYGGKLAAQDGAGEAIDAPPIPTQPDTAPTAPAAPKSPEMTMLPTLLATLLPQILNGFSPAGQVQAKPVVGQPAEQLAPLLLNLFSMIAGKTGIVPAGEVITTEQQAIAATAAFNAAKTSNPTLVAEIEQSALERMKLVGPMIEKLLEADRAYNEARIAGRTSAASISIEEHRAGLWDMTPSLVRMAGATATVVVLALLGAIIYQAVTGEGKIDTALVGIAGPLLAIAMSVWRDVFAYRFDGTPASNAANAINAELAATRPKA